MSKKVTLLLDGHEIKAHAGESVLEAALAHGIYIPHLCHDQDLKPHGACRLRIVEIKGMKGFPAACATEAAEGMVVNTSSAGLDRVRRDTLELMLTEHPLDCLTCTANQRCELQKAVAHIGGLTRTLRRTGKSNQMEALTPFFGIDRDYCILCQKCVRACEEIARKNILTVIHRGAECRIASFAGEAEKNSACRDCLECVKKCPTAALKAVP